MIWPVSPNHNKNTHMGQYDQILMKTYGVLLGSNFMTFFDALLKTSVRKEKIA